MKSRIEVIFLNECSMSLLLRFNYKRADGVSNVSFRSRFRLEILKDMEKRYKFRINGIFPNTCMIEA